MEFMDVVEQRYSVRQYQDRPVEEGKLLRILEAARLAPSASNGQEWRFIIVRDSERRRALVPIACNQAFVGQAPVVIAACAIGQRMMTCGCQAEVVDVAIALEHIALAATNEGLGTCWIGAFHQDQAKALLGLPDGVAIIQLMTLGYPADNLRPKNRLPLSEIRMDEGWRV